jgi:hypothetical protein
MYRAATEEIARCRDMADAPFGVNLTLWVNLFHRRRRISDGLAAEPFAVNAEHLG